MSVDWRSRHFAFRGRAGEPPDMNETVKAPTLQQVLIYFCPTLRREAICRFFACWVEYLAILARVAPSLAY
jgi:hypothetical protein